jgi:N-acetylglucosamine-6-phosphate deacetylase
MLPRPTAPDGLCTTGIKKCLADLGTHLGSHISKARSCVSEALANVQAAIVRSPQCSVGSVDTHIHGYSGDMTRQDGITGRAMFSATEG